MKDLDPDYRSISILGLTNHLQHEVERMKVAASKKSAARRIKAIGAILKEKKQALQEIQ